MTLFNFRDMYATKFGLPLTARFNHAEEKVERMVKEVLQQHSYLDELEAKGRALARLDAMEFQRLKAKTFIVTKNHNWRRWAEIAALALLFLAVVVLSAKQAHCQIDVIKFQDSSGTTLGVAAAPFTLKVASGCTWSRSGSIWTIGCTTGTVTNNPGSPSTSVQYNCAGAFCGIPEVHLGAVLIDQGPGNPPAFADPLVQGLNAEASTTASNPVNVGGFDAAGTPAVHGAKVVNGTPAGTEYAFVTRNIPSGTQAVSGTFWQATQPVSGTFWQATQPVSGTFWQTTQPVSIASMPSTPVTGTFWQATQPVSGTVTTTPPANASTNIAQVAGTTTDTNSGVKSAGTLRVVIATDQPALTNKLLVTPDSVALPANQSVNVSQINGVTPLMGNGVTGTGSQRVTIASDNTAISVNAAQSGTYTVQPGNTANTTPWLTTDSATSATGSAVPAKAAYIGGSDGTNLVGIYVDPCQRGAHSTQNISLTASAQLIAGTSLKKTYICSINIVSASADNVALVEGTGTVCATGIAGMAGGTTAATGWNFAANGGLTLGNGQGTVLNASTAADNVCLLVSGATQVSGSIQYVQF